MMIWTDLSLRNEIHIESKGNFTRLTWGEQCHTFEPEVRSQVWTSRLLATCLSLKKVKVTRLDLKGKATCLSLEVARLDLGISKGRLHEPE